MIAARYRLDVSLPVAAWPTTSISGSVASITARPRRIGGWSSTARNRMRRGDPGEIAVVIVE
jgi:hypothetical protein